MRDRKSGIRHSLSSSPPIWALLYMMLAICLDGCRSGGTLISTNLSLSSYADARQRISPGQPSMLYFPVLEIYNDSGVLVYRSHESLDNAKILRGFPNSVRKLPPQQDAPRLSRILEEIPDFKPRKPEIVGKRELVILSVALESCEACSAQENALEDLKRRLLKEQSVAILEISVAHP
jgi:hypothetical protein